MDVHVRVGAHVPNQLVSQQLRALDLGRVDNVALHNACATKSANMDVHGPVG